MTPDDLACAPGSSPRMRGTPGLHTIRRKHMGIIPAHAGNTAWLFASKLLDGDHPRVCGEHSAISARSSPLQGSSPRMRGTPRAGRRPAHHPGIIPAYAGNTCQSPCQNTSGRDHPRVCGEHHVKDIVQDAKWGSSPRMRGTLGRLIHLSEDPGIIPAYAGNTSDVFEILPVAWGSSPRMRGTLHRNATAFRHLGIIPAYAGNTACP